MSEPRRGLALHRAMTAATVILFACAACDGEPAPAPATPPAAAASPDPAPSPAADPRAEPVRVETVRVETVRAWARQQPGFAMKRWDVVLEPPFGVAWEVTGDAASDARQEQTARAFAVLGRKLHESWRESFAGPLGLPDLAGAETLIPFVVTAEPALSDETWTEHAWRGILHAPIPPKDLDCADGRVQLAGFDPFPRVAARRIVDAHRSAASRGAGELPYWLATGLENFLSAVEVDATFRADPARTAVTANRTPALLRHFIRGTGRREDGNLRGEAAAWTLDALLAAESSEVVESQGEPSADGAARGAAFRWQAWALVSFLWNYDGARYRPQLLDLLRTAIDQGVTRSDVLRILHAADPAARERLNAELQWYSCAALSVPVICGTAIDPRRREITDPPAGRYEPDDDE